MKLFIRINLLVGLMILLSGCRIEPAPHIGFSESLYFAFDFMGDTYSWDGIQSNTADWSPNARGLGFYNVFGTTGVRELSVGFHFSEAIEASSIEALEGKSIAASSHKGFPYISMYWEIGDGESYTTRLGDMIDYGVQTFDIKKVIKSEKMEYGNPLNGIALEGRSYIIRGKFDINISKYDLSIAGPKELFPITNGLFSLRVFTL